MSAKPNRPSSRAGSVGLQSRLTERYDSGSPSMILTSTSSTIQPPTGLWESAG